MSNQEKRKRREKEKRAAAVHARRSPGQVVQEKRARRECGECQACCEKLAILELKKLPGTKCPNQCAGGCAIYPTRPESCAGYICMWRDGWGEESDRPDRINAIFDLDHKPEIAALAGSRRPGGFVVRVHPTEGGTLSFDAIRRVQHLVRGGECVVVALDDKLDIYGPNRPHGGTIQISKAIAMGWDTVVDMPT